VLRRTVQRLRPCLGGLPTTERRVLVLRAGLGTDRTRSRAEVARMAQISRRRVARVEAAGLRRLARLARASGCGGSGSEAALALTTPAGEPLAPGPGGGVAEFAALAGVDAQGSRAAPGIGVLAERSSSAPGDRRASSPGSGPELPVPGAGDAGETAVAIPLLTSLLLGGLAIAALRRRRARLRDRWDPSDPW
jgi:hypothetical protein